MAGERDLDVTIFKHGGASVFVPLSRKGARFLRLYPEAMIEMAEHTELSYPQFAFVGHDLVVSQSQARLITEAMKLARLHFHEYDPAIFGRRVVTKQNPRRRKMAAMILKVRARRCRHRMVRYEGSVPGTGALRCVMCGLRFDPRTRRPIGRRR